MGTTEEIIVIKVLHEESGRNLCIKFNLSRLRDFLSAEVFDVLSKLPKNGTLLDMACLKALPSYVTAICRILGTQSKGLFGENCLKTICVFRLDHLYNQYDADSNIEFELIHKSDLDPHLCPKDLVYYIKIASPPYFVGDYNKKKPDGLMELAATVQLKDLIWVDDFFLFVGLPYWWEDQYLCHISTSADKKRNAQATLDRVLYTLPIPTFEPRNYASMVKYREDERGETKLVALDYVSSPGDEVRVLGPDTNKHLVRPGMGVVFETALGHLHLFGKYIRQLNPKLKNFTPSSHLSLIYGLVIGFHDSPLTEDSQETGIVVRVHLCHESTPEWLVSKMKGSYLIQTNLEATISSSHLMATFSIWPVALFQGTCAAQECGSLLVNDKVVVGHLHISLDKNGQKIETSSASSSHFSSEGDSDANDFKLGPKTLEPIMQMFAGRASLEVMRVKPLQPWQALDYIHQQNTLMNICASLSPLSHLVYLRKCFENFCREKARHIKTTKQQRTFHPMISGRVLIEILHPHCSPRTASVSVSNMTISIIFRDPRSLNKIFERNMAEFDYRSEGYGIVKLTGPVTFKWEMCCSEDGSQPADGRVSVTVFGWEDLDRFGEGAIKVCQAVPVSQTKKRHNEETEQDYDVTDSRKMTRSNAKVWTQGDFCHSGPRAPNSPKQVPATQPLS